MKNDDELAVSNSISIFKYDILLAKSHAYVLLLTVNYVSKFIEYLIYDILTNNKQVFINHI